MTDKKSIDKAGTQTTKTPKGGTVGGGSGTRSPSGPGKPKGGDWNEMPNPAD